jgi:beta-1,4-mannosyl-glycoprotein beta-1,4-N-acetylglucosaminyltransferase
MKYDGFFFNDELMMLDFRLHHVYDHVDKIIIVEGDRKFDGTPKPSYLKQNWELVKWAEDKIIHTIVKLDEYPADRWANEHKQRNGWLNDVIPQEGDVFFITCVDEIVRTDLYDGIIAPVEGSLVLDNYYYYFNCKDVGTNPTHPMSVVFSEIPDSVNELWEKCSSGWSLMMPDCGWHFSYLGGVDTIKRKLSAFSHAEYDNDGVKNALADNLKNLKDPFDRDEHTFEIVKLDDHPEYLMQNLDKYKEYIHV